MKLIKSAFFILSAFLSASLVYAETATVTSNSSGRSFSATSDITLGELSSAVEKLIAAHKDIEARLNASQKNAEALKEETEKNINGFKLILKLQEAEKNNDELAKRVAELEKKLKSKWVTTKKTDIYEEPNKKSTKITHLGVGSELTIEKQANGFGFDQNIKGWAPLKNLKYKSR